MWLLTYRRQVKMHWTGRGFLLVHPVNATANLSHINVDGVIAAWVCAQFSCVSFVSVSVCAHDNCIGYQARSTKLGTDVELGLTPMAITQQVIGHTVSKSLLTCSDFYYLR